MAAVRGWLAASIPLDFSAPADFGSNLIAWPVLETRLVPAGGTEAGCVFCGESSLEYLYIVVAVFPDRNSSCAAPVHLWFRVGWGPGKRRRSNTA